jgi:nucleoside-diphosphate-sugar epimerase
MTRVVVVGATGNAGTSLVELLSEDPRVDSIVGIARRIPSVELGKMLWRRADIAIDDLQPIFAGADAVVHLARAIQPSRDIAETERINVGGSRRVFEDAARAGVSKVVYASSVGAYSPSNKTVRRDESWPTGESLARSTRGKRQRLKTFSIISRKSIQKSSSCVYVRHSCSSGKPQVRSGGSSLAHLSLPGCSAVSGCP